MITLTYPFKLKVNRQQTQEIEHILSVCRSVYNYALAERKHWYNSRKSPVNSCSLISEYIIPANALYPSYNNQAKKLNRCQEDEPRLKIC